MRLHIVGLRSGPKSGKYSHTSIFSSGRQHLQQICLQCLCIICIVQLLAVGVGELACITVYDSLPRWQCVYTIHPACFVHWHVGTIPTSPIYTPGYLFIVLF
uniref:Uncharacterized protein n=1 Tax=Cacopsylla melanoneura TaxID=428564 RepID=A0A8D8Z7K8_9HEMI